MGGEPRIPGLAAPTGPFIHALRMLLLYCAACAAAGAVTRAADARSYKEIASVLIWFGGFSVTRALIARRTTIGITDTIRSDILPYASPRLIEAVAADLERRDNMKGRIVWPLLLAFVSGLVGTAAFAFDMRDDLTRITASPEAWFGIAIMILGAFISARSVGATGFYISFAEQLEREPSDDFFVLGAAESPLVQGLARLGGQVLVFWVMIFVAILSSLLLILRWPSGYGLPEGSRFVMTFVPLAGFVTLGFGSLVYLRSEAKIRAALRGFTQSHAAALQQRIDMLLDPIRGRIPADAAEIDRLIRWHDRILVGGRYGSRAGTAVSIALPFLLPVVSFVRTIYESLVGTTS